MCCDVVGGVASIVRLIGRLYTRRSKASMDAFKQICLRTAGFVVKPGIWLAMVGTNILGIVFPMSARKIYASFERNLYNRPGVLAACFQPRYVFSGTGDPIPRDFRVDKQEEGVEPIRHTLSSVENASSWI